MDFRWNDETLHFTRRAAKLLISVSSITRTQTSSPNPLNTTSLPMRKRKSHLVSLLLTILAAFSLSRKWNWDTLCSWFAIAFSRRRIKKQNESHLGRVAGELESGFWFRDRSSADSVCDRRQRRAELQSVGAIIVFLERATWKAT